MDIQYVEKHMVACAEEELRGPFKKLKIEIVRQSIPMLCACGADEKMRDEPPKFEQSVICGTNYDVKGFFLPAFILHAIIVAVVQWLVMRWLDRWTRNYF
jgi:hypothetical protein